MAVPHLCRELARDAPTCPTGVLDCLCLDVVGPRYGAKPGVRDAVAVPPTIRCCSEAGAVDRTKRRVEVRIITKPVRTVVLRRKGGSTRRMFPSM